MIVFRKQVEQWLGVNVWDWVSGMEDGTREAVLVREWRKERRRQYISPGCTTGADISKRNFSKILLFV